MKPWHLSEGSNLAAPRIARELDRWTPVQDAFEIIHEDGADYIRRVDGETFMTASFTVPMTYTVLPKDYAPFMPYSDGGMLLHSGRFQVCPEDCVPEGSAAQYPMHLNSNGNGEHFAERRKRLWKTDAAWLDSGEGTMVYIGSEKPLETDYVLAIIDPNIPEDITAMLNTLFPKMMAFYAAELGALDLKPMLFASLDRYTVPDGNPNSNSFTSQGGTLPGQVFMHLEGDGWLEPLNVRGEYTRDLAWFFAHEAGHMYQRVADYDYKEEDSWIHEGGAEAFAAIAMETFKLMPETALEKRKTDAVDTCLEGLKAGDLRQAGARKDFDLYYACGMIIQLAAHKNLLSKGEEKGIFSIWEKFLEDLNQNQKWNENTFMSVLSEQTDPNIVVLSEHIISGDPSLKREKLIEAIR